mmetsp:Transcript_23195/g.64943  ORF Transcript_23195/g.64943 Transcript_23195/m.64943 type:complete len:232 (-) Transcript_23195:996-1691(-)
MAGCPSRYRRSALSVDPPGLQGCVRGVQWPLQELQRRVRGLQRRARGLRGAGGPRRTGVVAVGHERRADEETRVWAARHAAFIPSARSQSKARAPASVALGGSEAARTAGGKGGAGAGAPPGGVVRVATAGCGQGRPPAWDWAMSWLTNIWAAASFGADSTAPAGTRGGTKPFGAPAGENRCGAWWSTGAPPSGRRTSCTGSSESAVCPKCLQWRLSAPSEQSRTLHEPHV